MSALNGETAMPVGPIIDLAPLAEVIAARVAELLAEQPPTNASPWMGVDGAADYLSCSPERIRKLIQRRAIPFHQERPGGRVFLNRLEIDRWMLDS